MTATESILDEMKIGTAGSLVPVDYLLDDKKDEREYLKRIYQRHRDRVIERACEKASSKARREIIRHTHDIEQQVPKEKRAKLTVLYASKYRDRLSLVGLKRFIIKNKDMSAGEIDTAFNRVQDWGSFDPTE
jgi:hypothetical protein